jgi:hypothetical protein
MGERSLLEQAISDDVGSGDAVKTISIRVLMAVVAIAALAMAMGVMVKRSNEFRALAEDQAESEQMSLAYADEGRGETGDPQRVARGEQMAAYHQKLRIKYERAARYPWLAVEPDPPVPDPPPSVLDKGLSPWFVPDVWPSESSWWWSLYFWGITFDPSVCILPALGRLAKEFAPRGSDGVTEEQINERIERALRMGIERAIK